MNYGRLFIIPTPLSGTDLNTTLLPKDIDIIKNIQYYIVETPKIARAYLKSIQMSLPIQEINIEVFDEHTSIDNVQSLIQPIISGHDIGLMTDAGTPCVADPGEEIVLMCQRLNIEVIPLVGPSSILLSLMGSGLNAERFSFNGYLPSVPNERENMLLKLVEYINTKNETQIFIETPYRNQNMFNSIMGLQGDIKLSLGINIGSENSKILTMPISMWKGKNIKLEKVPIIYLLGK